MMRKLSASLSGRGGNPDHKQRLLEISDDAMKHGRQGHDKEHHHHQHTHKKKGHGHGHGHDHGHAHYRNSSLTHSQETYQSSITIQSCFLLIIYFALFFEGILFIGASCLYLSDPDGTPGNFRITATDMYEYMVIVTQSTIIIMCFTFLINFTLKSHVESTVLNAENTYESPVNAKRQAKLAAASLRRQQQQRGASNSVSKRSYLAGLGYNLSQKMKQIANLSGSNDNVLNRMPPSGAPSIARGNVSMSSAYNSSLQTASKASTSAKGGVNQGGNPRAEDLEALKEEVENENDSNNNSNGNNNNNNTLIAADLNDSQFSNPSGGHSIKTSDNARDSRENGKRVHRNTHSFSSSVADFGRYLCSCRIIFALIRGSIFELLSMEWTEFNVVGMCSVSYYFLTAILYFTSTNEDLGDTQKILRGVGNLLCAFGFVLPGFCIHLCEKLKLTYEKRLTPANPQYYIDYSKTVGPGELGILSPSNGSVPAVPALPPTTPANSRVPSGSKYGRNSRVGNFKRGGRGRNRSGTDPNNRIGGGGFGGGRNNFENFGLAGSVGSGGSHKPQLNMYQFSSNASENSKTIVAVTSWLNSSVIRTWFIAVFLMHLIVDLSLIFVKKEEYYKGIYYTYFKEVVSGKSPNSLQTVSLYLNYIILRPFSIVLIVNTVVLIVALSFDSKYRKSQFGNLKEIFTPFSSIFVVFLVVLELMLRSNSKDATLIVGLIWIGIFIFISVFECYILLTLLDIQDAAEKEKERLYGYKKTEANIFYVVGGIMLVISFITVLLLFILNDSRVDKRYLIQPIGIVYFNLTQIIMLYPLKTIAEVPSFRELSCCCCFVCIFLYKRFSLLFCCFFFLMTVVFCFVFCCCCAIYSFFKRSTKPKYLYMFRTIVYINIINLIYCFVFITTRFGTQLLNLFNYKDCIVVGDKSFESCVIGKNLKENNFDSKSFATSFVLSFSFILFSIWSLEEFLPWILSPYNVNNWQIMYEEVSESGRTWTNENNGHRRTSGTIHSRSTPRRLPITFKNSNRFTERSINSQISETQPSQVKYMDNYKQFTHAWKQEKAENKKNKKRNKFSGGAGGRGGGPNEIIGKSPHNLNMQGYERGELPSSSERPENSRTNSGDPRLQRADTITTHVTTSTEMTSIRKTTATADIERMSLSTNRDKLAINPMDSEPPQHPITNVIDTRNISNRNNNNNNGKELNTSNDVVYNVNDIGAIRQLELENSQSKHSRDGSRAYGYSDPTGKDRPNDDVEQVIPTNYDESQQLYNSLNNQDNGNGV